MLRRGLGVCDLARNDLRLGALRTRVGPPIGTKEAPNFGLSPTLGPFLLGYATWAVGASVALASVVLMAADAHIQRVRVQGRAKTFQCVLGVS